MLNDVNPERRCKIWIVKMITTCSHLFRVLWDALDAAFEKGLLKESPETDAKMPNRQRRFSSVSSGQRPLGLS